MLIQHLPFYSFTFQRSFYLFQAFKSNHSPLFWRGAGGEALSLFWRAGGEASVLPLFIALRKGAGTAHNKKDGDAIVLLAYVIASPSFLFKLEA